MGFFASDHPDVPMMRGLHLFHFMLSNCSQRVRIALEEKELAWESHHVNIPGNEHVTSDYTRINPNAVVPTLVHDGRVVIESNDIIAYLDDTFPSPPLRPVGQADRRAMVDLIKAASSFQSAIKVLSHDRLFRPFRVIREEEIGLYESSAVDPSLVQFLRDYSENGDAWAARVAVAEKELGETLDSLEAALGRGPWLSGEAYGLADVSWVVNVNRLEQAQVDLSKWQGLADWGQRAMARPAFVRAVRDYRP